MPSSRHGGCPARSPARFVYTFEESIAEHVASGRLNTILAEHCPSFPGPYLYYPAQRHVSAPLRAFVDFIQQARRDRRR